MRAHGGISRGLAGLVLLWLLAFVGEAQQPREARPVPHLFTFSHPAMATTFTLFLYGKDAAQASAVSDEVFDEVDRVEQLLSNYRDSSELSRINQNAGSEAVTTDPEMMGFSGGGGALEPSKRWRFRYDCWAADEGVGILPA